MGQLTKDVDIWDGACWPLPDGAAADEAIYLDHFPIALVSWWGLVSSDWCCNACPTVPTEAPEDQPLECDGDRIAHYAARLLAGDKFPPIQVGHVPQPGVEHEWAGEPRPWVVDDGMHRISAYLMAGRSTIPADVYAADLLAAADAAKAAQV